MSQVVSQARVSTPPVLWRLLLSPSGEPGIFGPDAAALDDAPARRSQYGICVLRACFGFFHFPRWTSIGSRSKKGTLTRSYNFARLSRTVLHDGLKEAAGSLL